MAKVPVSERALLARINRKLKKDDEVVRRCREDARGYSTLGDYYRVDFRSNTLVDSKIDLEEEGRRQKVLAAHERLETRKDK